MRYLDAREPVRLTEWQRRKPPQPERVSGALLWPLMMVLMLVAFGLGVVHGRANPVDPTTASTMSAVDTSDGGRQ